MSKLTLQNNYSFYKNYTTNPSLEQDLYQNLTDEQINLYGAEIYYLPREEIKDEALSDVTFSFFRKAIKVKALLQNIDGFNEEQELIEKVDLYLTDEIRLLISTRQWNIILKRLAEKQEILDDKCKLKELQLDNNGELIGKFRRPIEGALLYYPLTKDLYEIKYVNQQTPFYQFGKIQYYELKAQIYSNVGSEKIEIDPDKHIDSYDDGEDNDNIDEELGIKISEDKFDVDRDGINDLDQLNKIEEEISPSYRIKVIGDLSKLSIGQELYTLVERRVGSYIGDTEMEASGKIKEIFPDTMEILLVDVDGIFRKDSEIYFEKDDELTGIKVISEEDLIKNETNESNSNAEFRKQGNLIIDRTKKNPIIDFNNKGFKND